MSALANIPIEEREELVESSNIIVEYMGFVHYSLNFFMYIYSFQLKHTYIHIYTYLCEVTTEQCVHLYLH